MSATVLPSLIPKTSITSFGFSQASRTFQSSFWARRTVATKAKASNKTSNLRENRVENAIRGSCGPVYVGGSLPLPIMTHAEADQERLSGFCRPLPARWPRDIRNHQQQQKHQWR